MEIGSINVLFLVHAVLHIVCTEYKIGEGSIFELDDFLYIGQFDIFLQKVNRSIGVHVQLLKGLGKGGESLIVGLLLVHVVEDINLAFFH